MEVLENTESICPECFKSGKINKIPAQVVEENGKIWIKKKCDEHGGFKSIVCGDKELYKRWSKYKVKDDEVTGVENIEIKSTLPPDSPLYPKHLSQSVLTNIILTNRCNLRCSYCFMNAGAAGYVYEPSLEQIKWMMEQVRNEKPVSSKAIQLTGGEPTMRDDLIDIIKMAKELGFRIHLNTNGIKLSESVEFCKKIKEAGVTTMYMSFDGVTEKTNPWIKQNKKAVENLRKAGLDTVLVPVVIGDSTLNEAADIIKYAVKNIDVVRGVSFQPISFTGRLERMSESIKTKRGVDYSALFDALEDGFDGQVTRDDFYPTPFIFPISKLIENLTGEPQVEFSAHPGCGGATYVYVQDGKLIPITRFIDFEGLREFIKELSRESGVLKKPKIMTSIAKNVFKFIDAEKVPSGLKIKTIAMNMLTNRAYETLVEVHKKFLFIGAMWFQDIWNLNMERLKRCVIHYSTLDGVIPFCAYNGLGVGEKIRKKYSVPIKEWEEKTGRKMHDDLWKNGPIS